MGLEQESKTSKQANKQANTYSTRHTDKLVVHCFIMYKNNMRKRIQGYYPKIYPLILFSSSELKKNKKKTQLASYMVFLLKTKLYPLIFSFIS